VRLVGLALAAGVGLTASIAAHAVPLGGQTGPAATGPAPGVVRVWGECGWGWHPVPGYWNQWQRGWVPPHCAPNHYRDWGGHYGGWSGPYEAWAGYGWGRPGPNGDRGHDDDD
jgi:hypothetical protein